MNMHAEVNEAVHELERINVSFNRLISQVEKSHIDNNLKEKYAEELKEMAFEIHHLAPIVKE